MTQKFYPLANSPVSTVAQWSKMAQNWISTGVLKGLLNELQVYADSTGMQVKVKSGQAFLKGHFFESDAEEVLPIASATTVQRIDRIILRLDWVLNRISLEVIQGIPASSPNPPALTQNSIRWEISLAKISVGANAITIASGNVTDERPFAWTSVGDQYSVAVGVAGQSTSPGTDTQITLIPQGNNYPLDSSWLTSNWTCPAAGVYEINTNILVNAAAGSLTMAKLFVNATLEQYLYSIYTSTAQLIGAASTTIKTLKTGDVLKFYVNASAAGATIAGNYSRINIKRIG